jgi:hypothetical protein
MRLSTSEASTKRRADQDGLAALVGRLDLLDDRVVLVAARLEDGRRSCRARMQGLLVGMTTTVEPVDLVELGGLGLGGAGHARQLLVHAEIVLDRDRRVRARLALDDHALLGLDRLVQAVGPAPAGMTRPVFSSTIITLPSWTTYSTSRS